MNNLVVGMQTWGEINSDFGANWLIYLSMPFVAAFVGWSTKIVALEMLYRPLEFKGIGPFGWQGIVPRRAGKVGSKTIELLTANLLNPEELLDRIDAGGGGRGTAWPAAASGRRDLAGPRRTDPPGIWDSLPEAGRQAVRPGSTPKRPGSWRTCSTR